MARSTCIFSSSTSSTSTSLARRSDSEKISRRPCLSSTEIFRFEAIVSHSLAASSYKRIQPRARFSYLGGFPQIGKPVIALVLDPHGARPLDALDHYLDVAIG